jgi:hypothetical protein
MYLRNIGNTAHIHTLQIQHNEFYWYFPLEWSVSPVMAQKSILTAFLTKSCKNFLIVFLFSSFDDCQYLNDTASNGRMNDELGRSLLNRSNIPVYAWRGKASAKIASVSAEI